MTLQRKAYLICKVVICNAALCVVLLAGQGAAHAAENKDWTSMGNSAAQARGAGSPQEALFVEKCSMCHRQMGMGTVILARRMEAKLAMLESRDDLTPEYIRVAVRSGLGNMPRITRGEVSDAQLAAITAHLVKRKSP
jgi:cytochrome c5